MTFVFAFSWWMVMPALFTMAVLYLAGVAASQKELDDVWLVLLVLWIVVMALILLIRYLP